MERQLNQRQQFLRRVTEAILMFPAVQTPSEPEVPADHFGVPDWVVNLADLEQLFEQLPEPLRDGDIGGLWPLLKGWLLQQGHNVKVGRALLFDTWQDLGLAVPYSDDECTQPRFPGRPRIFHDYSEEPDLEKEVQMVVGELTLAFGSKVSDAVHRLGGMAALYRLAADDPETPGPTVEEIRTLYLDRLRCPEGETVIDITPDVVLGRDVAEPEPLPPPPPPPPPPPLPPPPHPLPAPVVAAKARQSHDNVFRAARWGHWRTRLVATGVTLAVAALVFLMVGSGSGPALAGSLPLASQTHHTCGDKNDPVSMRLPAGAPVPAPFRIMSTLTLTEAGTITIRRSGRRNLVLRAHESDEIYGLLLDVAQFPAETAVVLPASLGSNDSITLEFGVVR